jgi:hypothetical protein
MIRVVLAVAMFGAMSGLAGPAISQSKQGEVSGSEISSKCAHRRMMPPDPRDNCPRQQGVDSIRGVEPVGTSAYGAGPGSGAGTGNGLGGGQAKGQR